MLLADDTDLTWPAPSNFPIVKKKPRPKAQGPREDGPQRAQKRAGGLHLLIPGAHRGPHQGRWAPTSSQNKKKTVRVRQFVGP